MTWTDTGFYDHGDNAKVPPKTAGKHRWVCTAAYVLTDEQARAGMGGTEDVFLDHESRFITAIGCPDCEQSYPECHDKPCPAGDTWERPQPGHDHAPGPLSEQHRMAAEAAERGHPEVPDPTDPTEQHSSLAPAGSKRLNQQKALERSVLLESVGVQPLITGRKAKDAKGGNFDEDSVELRLAISLVGKVNRQDRHVHHLYMAYPGTVGLLLAQLLSMMPYLGEEARQAFEERMAELSAGEGEEQPE